MKELKRMITKKVNVQCRFYMQHDHEILVMQYIYKLTRAMELGKCLELYGYIACKITLRRLREQYIFFIA